MIFKFGKLAPRFHRLTLTGQKYILLDAPPPPTEKRAWEYVLSDPEWAASMLANDEVGDCVIAAFMHFIMAVTANAGRPVTFTKAAALAVYRAVTGYDPSQTDSNGNNPTDQGTAWTDMLAYAQKVGVTDADGTVHKILGWASLNLDIVSLRQAINIFGGILIGTPITQSMMDQVNRKVPWNPPFSGKLLGGHAIPILGYGREGQTGITWAARQQMDPTMPYDEAYAVVTPDFVNAAQKKAPNGLDLDALLGDLAAQKAA